MTEIVEWLPDGTPRNPRFDDIYRSCSGGLAQARHVFLQGCGLPQAWASQPQWRVLETGFGLGLNFLATWHTWKQDPSRPRMLHFVSVEAWPVAASDLVAGAAPFPDLVPLARQLADQWFGLLPGVHRLSFEQGHVLLTLHIRDVEDALRREPFTADSVFLDGFDPRTNPQMWSLPVLKAVARHCRRGTSVATWSVAGQLRRDLAQCGFQVARTEGLPPKRECLQGSFSPAWEPKVRKPARPMEVGRCVVIGSGLAGAAVAASLSRRGWAVTVLDAAATPAAGASGLPVGLLVPHTSRDDNQLSRISRGGVRLTLAEAARLLQESADWSRSGVLERLLEAEPPSAVAGWSAPADAAVNDRAHLPRDTAGVWHEQGAWIKPATLVAAWLAHEGVTWRGGCEVAGIARAGEGWQLRDRAGGLLAEGDLVVVAAAQASAALVGRDVPLHPVRGQVSWGERRSEQDLPPFPVNGHGHFAPDVPLDGLRVWACGATFDRDDTDLAAREGDQQANLARLERLLPATAGLLRPEFETGRVKAWVGLRCASDTRRPLLGEIEPGLWISTAMGSRGLTFAALCAELLAARLHDEPLPLESRLAQALSYSPPPLPLP